MSLVPRRSKRKLLSCQFCSEPDDPDMALCDDCGKWSHFRCEGVGIEVEKFYWSCHRCADTFQKAKARKVETKVIAKKPRVEIFSPFFDLESNVLMLEEVAPKEKMDRKHLRPLSNLPFNKFQVNKTKTDGTTKRKNDTSHKMKEIENLEKEIECTRMKTLSVDGSTETDVEIGRDASTETEVQLTETDVEIGRDASTETDVQLTNENNAISIPKVSSIDASTMTSRCCSTVLPFELDSRISKLEEKQDLIFSKIDILVDIANRVLASTISTEGIKDKNTAGISKTTESSEAQGCMETTKSSETTEGNTEISEITECATKVIEITSDSAEELACSLDKIGAVNAIFLKFPFYGIPEAEELDELLIDSTLYTNMSIQLANKCEQGAKAPSSALNIIFSKQLQGKLNWDKKGSSIQNFPRILKLIHSAGKIAYDTYNPRNADEMLKNLLRNARAKKK